MEEYYEGEGSLGSGIPPTSWFWRFFILVHKLVGHKETLSQGSVCAYIRHTVKDIRCLAPGTMESSHTLHAITPAVVNEIIQITVPSDATGSDRIQWRENPDGCYTTTSAYQFLNGYGTVDIRCNWKQIWSAKIPEKIRMFLWLIAKDALPTNVKRHRNHLALNPDCAVCASPLEDMDHLFRGCRNADLVWQALSSSVRVPSLLCSFPIGL